MCLTLGDPMDYNLPGSSLQGILEARMLEWVGLPFSSPGDLHNPGIEPGSPVLQADSLLSEPQRRPQFSHNYTSFSSLPPLLLPHPSMSSQSIRLGSLRYMATSHQLPVLLMVVYIFPGYFNFTLYNRLWVHLLELTQIHSFL